ncbi:MAG TPA: HAD family phosphatase [Candidatus Limnocylindrales bacterium]|nr:HAD family phosphatase [Candidatus Limnocylindrales bacterium]
MTGNNRGTARYEAVILDYGAVLCHGPLPHEIERMARIFGVAAAQFPALYAHERGSYDRGDLTTTEYWESVARKASVELTPETIEQLRRWDMEMWSRVNQPMKEWLAGLRGAGFQTALLSNMQHDMIEHVRASFAWLGDFDHQIFSAEVRCIKPDEAIYRRCLEQLGVDAPSAIFVDDREENVAAARRLGIAAFQFSSVPQLRRDLESTGFPHLP